jgi:FkbM family methyltransferase
VNIANAIGIIVRFPFKLIPRHAHMYVLQGPLRGKRWIAGSGLHRCWLGFYEYKKQKAFSAALRNRDIVYDLGANVGFYSLLASQAVGSEGKVFSFEPALGNLEFLRRHLQLNQVKNCSVLDLAVSSCEGIAGFDQGPNRSMGHLTLQSSQNVRRVRTVTLDKLVTSGQIPPPDVIKCDIEGAEYDALIGASQILKTYAPMVFLATHGSDVHERCCRLLSDLQYQLKTLDGLPLSQSSEILAIRPNLFG